MTEHDRIFYGGMLAALAVVALHDQETLYREIVNSADADELVNVALAEELIETSGLARYGYAPPPAPATRGKQG